MRTTKLGRTGCEVTRLALGSANFGVWTREEEALRILDRAGEAGINLLDTANVYGAWEFENKGRAESIIGRWLSDGAGRRDRVVLATKVYCAMGEGPNQGDGLSALKLRRQVEDSLRRLRTDRIDLYQMHYVDRGVGWDELWGAFEDLVRAGKVVYVGSSNFAGWDIARAQGAARERGFLGLVSEQHKYSLVCRLPELEVLPACRAHGVAVLPWAPMGGGLLGGRALRPEPGARSDEPSVRAAAQRRRAQVEAFEALAARLGERPAVVALAWVLANPAVTSPIVGPRSAEQLEELLRALEVRLGDEVMAELDRLFPGPGGEGPRAYVND